MTQQQSQSSSFAFSAVANSTSAGSRLSRDGERVADELAAYHDFSKAAVAAMLVALERGRGTQAQFDHPEFGGMGQWSRGGMLMIGDMFNDALKARVGALAQDAAVSLERGGLFEPASVRSEASAWPSDLGLPAATGSQNDMHYAFFPESRRLAIMRSGMQEIYDTGDHQFLGFSQQQGGTSSLSFASQHGPVPLSSLRRVDGDTSGGDEEPANARPEPPKDGWRRNAEAPVAPAITPIAGDTGQAGAIIAAIEGLAGLHAKGILGDDEFRAKKAELLARL